MIAVLYYFGWYIRALNLPVVSNFETIWELVLLNEVTQNCVTNLHSYTFYFIATGSDGSFSNFMCQCCASSCEVIGHHFVHTVTIMNMWCAFILQFNSATEVLQWLSTILYHSWLRIQVVHNKDSTSVSNFLSSNGTLTSQIL